MIILSRHFQEKLLERPELRLEWVERVVTAPDRTAPDPDPALTRSYKAVAEFGGRVLRVVHRRKGTDVLIVTAHFDRGARI